MQLNIFAFVRHAENAAVFRQFGLRAVQVEQFGTCAGGRVEAEQVLQSAQFAAGLFQAFPADAAFRRFGAIQHAGDNFQLPGRIGIVNCADPELLNQIAGDDMVRGITIACGGFYGPQGRELRAPLADPELNQKIEAFEYKGLRVNNFEMESSALAGLSLLLGHKALTCCMVIANRRALSANTGYKSTIDNLIKVVLDRI